MLLLFLNSKISKFSEKTMISYYFLYVVITIENFHTYGDVIIAGERLLCSLTAQGHNSDTYISISISITCIQIK